jgi:hypothetical protein
VQDILGPGLRISIHNNQAIDQGGEDRSLFSRPFLTISWGGGGRFAVAGVRKSYLELFSKAMLDPDVCLFAPTGEIPSNGLD